MRTREELLAQFRHDLPPYVDPLSGSSPYEPADDLELAIGTADYEIAQRNAVSLGHAITRMMMVKYIRDRRSHSWRGEPQCWRTTTEVEVLR